MRSTRTYSDVRRLETFEERYEYLALRGSLGTSTFGFDRWLNQRFYRSREWKRVRDSVIVRDSGCDLGIPGYEIHSGLIVHHMNPFTVKDLEEYGDNLLDPQFLITTSLTTHNAIHYGDASQLPRGPIVRQPGDTKLW
jgi:hypothetical protein